MNIVWPETVTASVKSDIKKIYIYINVERTQQMYLQRAIIGAMFVPNHVISSKNSYFV